MKDPRGGSADEFSEQTSKKGKNKKEKPKKAPKKNNASSKVGKRSKELTVASKGKATRYVVVAVLFLFVAIGCCFGYTILHNKSISDKQTTCWSTQVEVESLVQQYITRTGASSAPAYLETVADNVGLLQCPSGGGYTWNPVTQEFTCSFHGHYPADFARPTSTVTGVNETVIATNENSSSNPGEGIAK